MSNLPAKRDWEDATPIELADGSKLNRPQSHAIRLIGEGKLSQEQIAKACGYTSKAGLQVFLRTAKAQEALGQALIQGLHGHAVVAMNTLVKLAKHSKSDLVRFNASKDLLDRAGITAQQLGTAQKGQSFTINIGLEGGGGKSGDVGSGNPGHPVQNAAEKGPDPLTIEISDAQELSPQEAGRLTGSGNAEELS